MGNCIKSTCSHIEKDEVAKVFRSNKKLSKLCRRKRPSRGSRSLRLPERVRIVVNKKQFERLIGSVEEVQFRRLVLESLLRRARRWRPSLAAIPEL